MVIFRPRTLQEEMMQMRRHAKWAAQAALDAEARIKELEAAAAAKVHENAKGLQVPFG